ncbi:MAG: hypothetical protein H6511_05865 [Holophagales bacterium]|nr:hypothetical protein [Holophagales bacterium]
MAALAFLALPLGAQRLPITSFTADDGLAGTQVWDVHLDSRGYLWVATSWGLCRYDGERFTTLSVPEGLPSPTARTILEDAEGSLWIGTNSGVARYDGRRITRVDDLAAPRATVWASAIDPSGRLWFGTEVGLTSWDGSRVRAFGPADGLASEYVYALLAARDGTLWIGSRGAGLARCSVAADGALAGCRVFGPAELGHGVVRSFAETPEGEVLVGTRGAGLLRFRGDRFERFTQADGLPGDDVYALLVGPNGTTYVGTGSGLAICAAGDLRSCRVVREANGLRDDDVRTLELDREGSLWIGIEGGLARLDRADLWSYDAAEGVPGEHVYALYADPSGAIWTGAVGGLARLVLGPHGEPSFRVFGRAEGLPGLWVWAIEPDGEGRLWIGTESGICRLSAAGRCEWPFAEPEPWPGTIYALRRDRQGDLWVGTSLATGRIVGLGDPSRPPRLEVYTRADGLAFDRAYAFAEDAAGRVWIAHGEGLSWYEAGRFHAVAESEAPVRTVRSLGVGSDGTLWMGGYGHVTRLLETPPGAPLRFVTYGAEAGLGDVQVLTFGEDEHGHLLLGTNRGVLLFDPRAHDGRGGVLARFDRSEGPIATEVSHSSAATRDPDGNFWFGFKGGMSRFPAGIEPAAEAPPRVAIERLVSRRGREVAAPFAALDRPGRTEWLGDEPLVLASGDDRLRAEVRAVTLHRHSGLRYQIRLEGLDAVWPEPVAEPFREFTNLAPGGYRLLARAARAEGEWGEPAVVALTVRPAWWQMPLVRLGGLAALVALVAVAMGTRTRRAEARARELELRVGERTEDLARYARALAEHLSTIDRIHERARAREVERSDLLAKLGHEVRTPLTSILGFSELLSSAASGRLNPRELRFLANIRESGNHLLRLVNNLLDQAKLEAGRMEVHLEEVSLAALLSSVVSLMEGFAVTRGVRLEVSLAPGLDLVRTDVAKLRQILLNLLSNAIKFSPPDGAVTVGARAVAATGDGRGRDGYELSVADEGPGIGAEDIERIFEPYRQASSPPSGTPGTGLGLPIARQLARLMGGRIEVDRERRVGSRFLVLLPAEPERAIEENVVEELGSGGYDLPRVLLVETDPKSFRDYARELEPAGRLVVRAPDLEEARRMIRELEPIAVVAHVDPSRPEDWQATASLERELVRSGVPLVALVSVAGGSRGWALGFDRLLPATVDAEEVAQTVASLASAREGAAGEPVAVLLGGDAERRPAREAALAAAGFRVRSAGSPAAALEALEGEEAAAVLVDPEGGLEGGLEFVRALQREVRGREIPWILLLPGELSAPVRRRYAEEVERAREPLVAELAHAVEIAEARHASGRATPQSRR